MDAVVYDLVDEVGGKLLATNNKWYKPVMIPDVTKAVRRVDFVKPNTNSNSDYTEDVKIANAKYIFSTLSYSTATIRVRDAYTGVLITDITGLNPAIANSRFWDIDSEYLYIPTGSANRLEIISLTTLTKVATVVIPSTTTLNAKASNGKIYVVGTGLSGYPYLYIVNKTTFAVTNTILLQSGSADTSSYTLELVALKDFIVIKGFVNSADKVYVIEKNNLIVTTPTYNLMVGAIMLIKTEENCFATADTSTSLTFREYLVTPDRITGSIIGVITDVRQFNASNLNGIQASYTYKSNVWYKNGELYAELANGTYSIILQIPMTSTFINNSTDVASSTIDKMMKLGVLRVSGTFSAGIASTITKSFLNLERGIYYGYNPITGFQVLTSIILTNTILGYESVE